MEKNEAQRLAVPLPEAFASIWFSINFPRVVRVVMGGRGGGGGGGALGESIIFG